MSAREINILSYKVSQLAERVDGMAAPATAPATAAAAAFDEAAFLEKVDAKIAAADAAIMQKVAELIAAAAVAPAADSRRARKGEAAQVA